MKTLRTSLLLLACALFGTTLLSTPAMAQEFCDACCDWRGGHEPVVIILDDGTPVCVDNCTCPYGLSATEVKFTIGYGKYEQRLRGVSLMHLSLLASPVVNYTPIAESGTLALQGEDPVCDEAVCYVVATRKQ